MSPWRASHPRPIEELFGRRTGDIRPGLERVRAAWEKLGYPARETPTVLVAGTNGKGTVCAFAYHLLSLLGFRTGLYTSPHLVNFRERIQVNDCQISDEDLVAKLSEIRGKLGDEIWLQLSFFEVTTLLALSTFTEQQTEINILEVGMGGRWDATNITDPVVSAVVSVGLDHQKWLGSDVAAIAAEKACVARPGRPLFWGGISCTTEKGSGVAEENARIAGAVLEAHCRLVGAHFWRCDVAMSHKEPRGCVAIPGTESLEFELNRWLMEKPLFLRRNFSLAVAVVAATLSVVGSSGWRQDLLGALGKVGSPQIPVGPSFFGRFQAVEVQLVESGGYQVGSRDMIIDVCHNIDGVRALEEALSHQKGGPRSAFVCILADKDIGGILDLLRGFLDQVVLFRIENDRSLTAEDLPARHRDLPLYETFAAAFDAAIRRWSSTSTPWVVCGSLAAVGDVIAQLQAFPQTFLPKERLIGRWVIRSGSA